MVFSMKYLFCLTIIISLFKPRAHTEMITATAEKKPLTEINIDVNEYVMNEEKSFEALRSHLITAEECYSLCKAFYSRSDFGKTLAWCMETLHKYKEESTEEHSFTEVDVLEYIAYVHYLLGDVKTSLEWTQQLLKLDPNHPRAAANVPEYNDIIAGHERASQYRGKTGDESEDEKANAIELSKEMHKLNVAKIHFMTAADCFALSKVFYYKKDYNHSLAWSMESLRKYKEETTEEHSFTEVDVLEYIAFTHYLMGDVKTALKWTKKLLKLDPNHPRAARNMPWYRQTIARRKLSEELHQFDAAKSIEMTAADCFELGKALYHKSEYKNSLAWNMESLRKYKNETTEEHSFTEVDLLEYIAFTHYLIGDVKTALEWTKKLLKLDPNHPRAVANVPYFEKVIPDKEAEKKRGKLSEELHQFDVAKSLQMTAADSFELGKALYHKSEYKNSLVWNMESLRKYKNETTEEHSFTEVDLLEYIAFTHYLIGDIKTALEWTKKLLKLDPYHPRAVANVPYFEKVITDKEAEKKRGDTGEEYEDETEKMPKFDVAKSSLMTAQGCFNLCKGFYFNNEFNNSLAWGMEALHKYKEETGKKHSFTEVELLKYIAFSHYMMGDIKSAVDWTKKLLKLDPNHARAAGNLPLFEEAIAEQEAATKKRGETGVRFEDETTGNETKMPKFDIDKSYLMTAAACFKLSKDFYFNNDFNTSLAWGMVALHKYEEEAGKKHSFTEVDVPENIGFSHYMMGDVKTALEWTQQLLKLIPNHQRAAKHEPIYEKAIAEQEVGKKKRLDSGVPTEDEKDVNAKLGQIISQGDGLSSSYPEIKLRYEALCRGEMEINSDVAKRLFCRYMSENHPFLRLAPIKAEQLFIEPDVFVFHGVLSDDEIQVIKVLSMPRLQRARVNNATAIGKTYVTNYRISKSAWLRDEESQVVARVSQRVADMTGLSMESAEELQVVNYGIGGHYEPHFDYARKNRHPFPQQDGNRIATVLFYMSDVVQGGATVFTELGLSVHPERGAALFFINLHPSGEGDTATRHAACPVLRGSKWVCNKWIHEGGQELTKPCNWDCRREESIRKIPRAARATILPL